MVTVEARFLSMLWPNAKSKRKHTIDEIFRTDPYHTQRVAWD